MVSLVAGSVIGVLGVTGVKGFGGYAAAHVLLSAALLAKAGLQPQRYFGSWCVCFTAELLPLDCS